MAELIGGALLGAVASELVKAVIHAKAKATNFKPHVEKLTITLQSVIPRVDEIKRLDDEERKRTDGKKGLDLDRLIMLLRNGKILVEKCLAVQSWNYILKTKYSGKMQELDNDLIRFFQLDAQVTILINSEKIWGKVNNIDHQLKQLMKEKENGSSSNNDLGDEDGGVNDLEAAVPTMITTSVVPDQKVDSAKSNEKLDLQPDKAAPIKPRNNDLKEAVPIKPAIIMTSTDPQKVGSAKASEELDRHSESAASIKPYDHDLKATVPITSADRQKDNISTSDSTTRTPGINGAVAALEVISFRDDESVAWYGKSFGEVAKTSLSDGLDLKFLLNCDSEKIETSPCLTDFKPPWIVSETTHSSAILCKAAQLVVLTRFRSFGTLNMFHDYDREKKEHHRHMELVESVRHENVVPLRAYYLHFRPIPDDQPFCLDVEIVLVYHYCRRGSVHNMLHGKPKVPLDWDTRLRVAIGVARGIAFIHKQDNGSFFHGCIKSENIFLNPGNYGCISELGKCIAGCREPYIEGRGSLRVFDVYNYGVLLLELVTGNRPYYGIVKKFKTCIGSREQLVSKVEYFIRHMQLNPEGLCFQLLDPELVKHYGELKGQLIEILRIAWDCVANRTPQMDDVVKMVESIGRAFAMLEMSTSFRDDTSVPFFSKSMGGVGRTSLPEGFDLKVLHKCHSKTIEDRNSSNPTKRYITNNISHATLYGTAQLVLVTRFRTCRPRGYDFHQMKTEHHQHMELVERVKHENVAPLKAYYYSFSYPKPIDHPTRPTPVEATHRQGLEIILVYDYYKKGSVFQMLHGKTKIPCDWDARLRVAIGVARGIAYIHKQDGGNFFHGKIKSTNIFLNSKGYGCISDLGKCLGGYADPDVSFRNKSGQQSDIYCYGVFLIELVTGCTPIYSSWGDQTDCSMLSDFRLHLCHSPSLVSTVLLESLVRIKQSNPDEPCYNALDPELLVDYEEFKEQVIEILQIAMDCVSETTPTIDDVVKVVEGNSFTFQF